MVAALKPVVAALNEGRPARAAGLDAEGLDTIKPLCLMTVKPTLYVANVSEDGFQTTRMLDALRTFADKEGSPVVPCVRRWRRNCRSCRRKTAWNT